MRKQANITVKGKVQNVGFRFFTQKRASETGIKGFVRNLADGSVYIEAEGEEANLDTFLDYVRIGPKWSRVDNISVQFSPASGRNDFSIKY